MELRSKNYGPFANDSATGVLDGDAGQLLVSQCVLCFQQLLHPVVIDHNLLAQSLRFMPIDGPIDTFLKSSSVTIHRINCLSTEVAYRIADTSSPSGTLQHHNTLHENQFHIESSLEHTRGPEVHCFYNQSTSSFTAKCNRAISCFLSFDMEVRAT